MWPFKKKIKIEFVPTESAIKKAEERKNSDVKEIEAKKALQARNRTVIKLCAERIIKEQVEYFKNRIPAPFKVGDLVTPLRCSFPPTLGWCGTANSFLNTFKEYDERINPNMVMPVSKIWVSHEFLKDFLDPDYTRNPKIQDCVNIEDDSYIYSQMNYEVMKLMERKGEVVEWVIDFQWNALRFNSKASDSDYLDLKWGGLCANTFISINHPLYDVQKNLNDLEKELEGVKNKIASMQETHTEMLNRYLKEKQ